MNTGFLLAIAIFFGLAASVFWKPQNNGAWGRRDARSAWMIAAGAAAAGVVFLAVAIGERGRSAVLDAGADAMASLGSIASTLPELEFSAMTASVWILANAAAALAAGAAIGVTRLFGSRRATYFYTPTVGRYDGGIILSCFVLANIGFFVVGETTLAAFLGWSVAPVS